MFFLNRLPFGGYGLSFSSVCFIESICPSECIVLSVDNGVCRERFNEGLFESSWGGVIVRSVIGNGLFIVILIR